MWSGVPHIGRLIFYSIYTMASSTQTGDYLKSWDYNAPAKTIDLRRFLEGLPLEDKIEEELEQMDALKASATVVIYLKRKKVIQQV